MLSLAVSDLTVDRGERRVLTNVSFQVAPGEALVVEGRNGSGKSTLLRALAGLVRPAAGAIALKPVEAAAVPDAPIHLIGHLNALKLQRTALQNARFFQRLAGRPADDEAAEAALDTVGLAPLVEVPAALLSQGQRRRMSLARLLLAPRPIWLLDEPTAGLDAASRATLATVVERHLASGGLAVAATHEPLGLSTARRLVL